MRRFALSALILAATLSSAFAQWGTPQYTIPVGRGPGFSGFTSVGPCLAGVPIVGAGVAASPVCGTLGAYAPLNSPIFTGNPTAPTPATVDNDTSVATTAFVQSNLSNYLNMVTGGATYMSRAAAISASTPASVPSILLLGYATAGDAGYGAYYVPMVCPAVTAPDFQDAGGRCWHLETRQPLLGFWGADRTGVADSTAAITAFHTYTFSRELCGNYQAGSYKFAGPIIISGVINPGQAPCFDGAGIELTLFNNTNLTSNDFVLDTSVAGMNGGRLTNIAFIHTGVKTAGTSIVQSGAQNLGSFKLENIEFLNTFAAVSYQTASNFYINGLFIHSAGPDARVINFDGFVHTANIDNLFFINGSSGAPGSNTTAIYIGGGSAALNFNKCHLQAGSPNPAGRGVWIAASSTVNYITFDGCYIDVFATNAFLMQSGTRVEFRNSNIMFTSGGNDGVRLTGGEWIWFHNNLFYGNQGHAIAVTSGTKDVRIHHNTFTGNGVGSPGNNDDINIGANTTNFSISDNNHCTPSVAGVAETPYVRYNVNVVAGTSNYYKITNNITGSTGTVSPHCHRTAGVFDGGTGTIKNVSGNPGSTWQTFVPTYTCAAGTPTTITTNAARYELAGPTVRVRIEATLTNIGTCTGALRIALVGLPTASTNTVISALNSSTIAWITGIVGLGLARVDVLAGGGAFPGVNGNIILVNGAYEATAP